MSIQYTYTIESVDTAARCMVVVYEAQGHTTQRVGTRIPFEGETLTDVIASFAPVSYWEDQARQLAVPIVGASGTMASVVAQETVVDAPSEDPSFVLVAENV
jgi:accessory colonization factor AcfC